MTENKQLKSADLHKYRIKQKLSYFYKQKTLK